MNENNGITICPKCGYKTTFSANFCPKCGSTIELPKEEPNKKVKEVFHAYSPQSQPQVQEQPKPQMQTQFQSQPQIPSQSPNLSFLRFIVAFLGLVFVSFNIYWTVTSWEYYFPIPYYADYTYIIDNVFFVFSYFLEIISWILISVLLIAKPKKKIIGISLFALVLLNLINTFWNIADIFIYDDFYYIEYYLPFIFYCLFNIFILIFIILISLGKLQSKNLLPIVIAAPIVIFLIYCISSNVIGSGITFLGWLYYFLYELSIILLGTYFLYGGETGTNASQNSASSAQERQESIVMLIVLIFLTLGIYYYVWIYKTSKFINQRSGKDQFSPGAETALCLLVPFYFLYWLYKESKNIYEISLRQNINTGDLSVPNLILGLFGFSIIAVPLMQNQINKLYLPQASYTGQQVQPNQNVHTAPMQNTQPYGAGNNNYERIDSAPAANNGTAENNELANNVEYIKQLKDLLDHGIISEEEFEAKKRKLLNL